MYLCCPFGSSNVMLLSLNHFPEAISFRMKVKIHINVTSVALLQSSTFLLSFRSVESLDSLREHCTFSFVRFVWQDRFSTKINLIYN